VGCDVGVINTIAHSRILSPLRLIADEMAWHGNSTCFVENRQRGTVPPVAPEFALHCMVADTLKRWALPEWEWTHLPFGEYRSAATAGKLARMGVRRGYADFAFFHADGRVAFLELKRRGRRLSPDQERIAGHMLRAGHLFACVDDYRDAVEVLTRWGVVRGGANVQ
jgi:hypothetical protein